MKLNAKIPEPIGFQLTPMLDVVFLLLIFFVVTQKFILNEQDLNVEVPTAAGNEKDASRAIDEVIINAREVIENEPNEKIRAADEANGRQPGELVITINRTEYKLENLDQPLRNLVNLNAKQPVCIRADKDMRWEKVVKVVEACTSAGVYNVRFKKVMPGETSAARKAATPAAQ